MKHLYVILGTLLLVGCGSKTTGTKVTAETNIRDTLVMPTTAIAQPYVDTINLGQMVEGEVVTSRFAVKNQGSAPLIIASTVTGCGCTNIKYDTAPIAPGTSIPITVTFDSRDRFGTQIKTLELITTDHLIGRMMLKCEIIKQ